MDGTNLGKDLDIRVTMSFPTRCLEHQEERLHSGLGTYLSGSGDLWQHLLLIKHLKAVLHSAGRNGVPWNLLISQTSWCWSG